MAMRRVATPVARSRWPRLIWWPFASSPAINTPITTPWRRFWAEFEAVFIQVLEVARENQLSRFGRVSLDGTKLHANASRHRC